MNKIEDATAESLAAVHTHTHTVLLDKKQDINKKRYRLSMKC